MTKNQNKGFWSMFVGFILTAFLSLEYQGFFAGLTSVGLLLLVFSFILCGFFVRLFVIKNSELMDSWFSD